MSPQAILDLSLRASFVILTLSMIIALIRIYRGPTLCNRVVAFDLLTTIGLCAMGVYVLRVGELVLLQVAVLASLITFLGTVGYAYYIEKERK